MVTVLLGQDQQDCHTRARPLSAVALGDQLHCNHLHSIIHAVVVLLGYLTILTEPPRSDFAYYHDRLRRSQPIMIVQAA
jgi:hypothetical protein